MENGSRNFSKEHKGKKKCEQKGDAGRENRVVGVNTGQKARGRERGRLQMCCFHAGLTKLCLQILFLTFFPTPAHFEGGNHRGWKAKLHG